MANSINYFPFQTDNLTNALRRCDNVNDTLISIVKQFLLTRKGSRLGNPIGSSLLDMLYNLYPKADLKVQERIQKQELTEQFPEISFHNVLLNIKNINDVSTLEMKITLSTSITDILEFELYFPVLNT